VKSSVLTQRDVFRVEAALAIIAAFALVVRPRHWTALIAFLVSAGGFSAVLVYQYVNVGAIGPLPNLYDPAQYPEKTLSVWADGIAAVAALVLLVLMHLRIRGTRTATATRAAARASTSRPAWPSAGQCREGSDGATGEAAGAMGEDVTGPRSPWRIGCGGSMGRCRLG
jgi:hypothetical protein